jgi:hypothetical protein
MGRHGAMIPVYLIPLVSIGFITIFAIVCFILYCLIESSYCNIIKYNLKDNPVEAIGSLLGLGIAGSLAIAFFGGIIHLAYLVIV